VAIHNEWIRQDSFGVPVGLNFSGFQDEDSVTEIKDEIEIVRNIDEFYEAFGCGEGDPMLRPLAERPAIW